ncbi:MoxR family ATPase [Moritella sp. Urea-trap-13]|uniref:AAA family ATPase n=1 Tax=Moritella sp. Urea-trap-13 TaxID=2058327 RepID=UPI000C32271E|nr:MoxR family ATPase [Moritella sp. Urea-trap-13]PKH04895.1 AAA family ATPase [Moritella sp. Urea-trap-13]
MSLSQQVFKQLSNTVNQSVVGQDYVVKALLIGLLTRGHVLLEGLPGTAKTRSIKALADAMNADFGRVQFTPDLLPSDVTGAEIYREVDGKHSLTFQPGPIFNNLVLADEINRAPAKVQSALLEAMAENSVTSAGETRQLPSLFMVLATQNPVEQEGTYPLPEAQIDRFMLKVNVDYPDAKSELAIIDLVREEELMSISSDGDLSKDSQPKDPLGSLPQGISKNSSSIPNLIVRPEHIIVAQREVSRIYISPLIKSYVVNLVMATRGIGDYSNAQFPQWLSVGASPRASIALDRGARAHAWLAGRDYVDPDDVRAMVHLVLGHRLVLSYAAISERITTAKVIDEILEYVMIG